MADVQAIDTNSTTLAGHYALANSIDATSTTSWNPIGGTSSGAAGFTGAFHGRGNTISSSNAPSNTSVARAGLFGTVKDGTIGDVGLTGGRSVRASGAIA